MTNDSDNNNDKPSPESPGESQRLSLPHCIVIIPAHNEAEDIAFVIDEIYKYSNFPVLVIDDASTDQTIQKARSAGAVVVPLTLQLGAWGATQTGLRYALKNDYDFAITMDADGQHLAESLPALLEPIINGDADVTIGACTSRGSALRKIAWSMMRGASGLRLEDLTSGFRVVKPELFRKFLYLLPNGFSYPTTITMAFLRSGYPICFEPIPVADRIGESHIRPIKDGIRFLVIIFKIATLYSPLKVFLPISALFFAAGAGWYAHTFVALGRFTNMSMLLFSAAVIVFLIGLISEQITALNYSKT